MAIIFKKFVTKQLNFLILLVTLMYLLQEPCLGYLRATNDMYEIMAKDSKRTICIPPGISGKQLTRIVVKYLNEHPERLQNIASLLVFEAFQESFPCSRPEPPQ